MNWPPNSNASFAAKRPDQRRVDPTNRDPTPVGRLTAAEPWFRRVVFVILGLVFIVEVLGRLGLYADGAHYFYYDLQTRTMLVPQPSRWLADALTQYPLIWSLKLGVRNITVLTGIFTAGAVGVPLLLWSLALTTVRRHRSFWLFVVAFVVAYGLAGQFSLSEYDVAYGAVAWVAALVAVNVTSMRRAVLLVAASALTLCTYPSLSFLGIVLALGVAYRMLHRWRSGERDRILGLDAIALIVLLVSAGIGEWAVLAKQGSTYGDSNNVHIALHLDHGQLVWTIIATLVFAAAWMIRRRSLAFVTLALMVPALVLGHLNPLLNQFNQRIVVGVGLSALLVVLMLRMDAPPRREAPLLAAAGVALLVWSSSGLVANALQFNQYLDRFSQAETSTTGIITDVNGVVSPSSDALLYHSSSSWGWGYQLLTVELVPTGPHAMVLSPGLTSLSAKPRGLTWDDMPLAWPLPYTR